MADHTHIEWTDATWNPVTGCSVVSPGCTNCYAMRLAGARLRDHPSRAGLTQPSKAGPVWNGQVRLNTEWLDQPLRWKKPRRIFVCAHGDLFHESVPDDWIDQVFAVMALAPQHTFQVLTKRAARMRAYMTAKGVARRIGAVMDSMSNEASEGWFAPCSDGKVGWLEAVWPLPNVWLGVSAEDQTRADERIPDLLATPAAVRFVSLEPLIGPVDLRPWLGEDDGCEGCDDGEGLGRNRCSYRDIPRHEQCPRNFAVFDYPEGPPDAEGVPSWIAERRVTLDWVIVGGESGPGARPMHPDWARQIRDACADAGVAFFFKQWGAYHPHGQLMADGSINCLGNPDDARWTSLGKESAWLTDKAAAGRHLDGVTHDAMPHFPREAAGGGPRPVEGVVEGAGQ